ncbi:MAG: T9SS type A sorting domain-containing protein [Flavobacteriales bacterium]|nr:T9SS type A sorting domain-containing protein [Flavobacteriales bacterium]
MRNSINILLLLLLLIGSGNLFSQVTTFRHVYGGMGDDYGQDIELTSDGGYIITGATGSFGYGQSDVYLLKIDSAGAYQWSRSYGGSNVDWGYDAEITSDGGYVIAGYTNSFGAGGYDFYLVRTDSVGDTLWTKTYGGWNWEHCYSMDITSDDGFVMVGETYSYGGGEKDVWIVKADEFGDTLWTKTFGGILDDWAKGVEVTFDDDIIICGSSYTYSDGDSDGLLIKLDNLGATEWFINYGGTGKQEFENITENNDTSGFACIGMSDPSLNNSKMNLVKFDSQGALIWDKLIGLAQNTFGISIEKNGSAVYAMVATNSNASGNIQAAVIDTAGIWQIGNYSSIVGPLQEQATDIIHVPGNGYAILGNTYSYGSGYSDVLLYKCNNGLATDTNIFITITDTSTVKYPIPYTGVDKNNKGNSIKIFPNPTSDNQITITSNEVINRIQLINILGQSIPILVNENENIYIINPRISISGVYFIEVSTKERIVSKKIVFE